MRDERLVVSIRPQIDSMNDFFKDATLYPLNEPSSHLRALCPFGRPIRFGTLILLKSVPASRRLDSYYSPRQPKSGVAALSARGQLEASSRPVEALVPRRRRRMASPRARRAVLRAALASCGLAEAHLSAAGSAGGSVAASKTYRAQPKAAEQSLPQPLAITPRTSVHFACPKCGDELLPSAERMLRCACGHSFDVAREGYVHLAKRTKASAEQQAESDAVGKLVEVAVMVRPQLAGLACWS